MISAASKSDFCVCACQPGKAIRPASSRSAGSPKSEGSAPNLSRQNFRDASVLVVDQIGRQYSNAISTLNRPRVFGKPVDICVSKECGFNPARFPTSALDQPRWSIAIWTRSDSMVFMEFFTSRFRCNQKKAVGRCLCESGAPHVLSPLAFGCHLIENLVL